ncbi:Sodium/solute symporter [Gracilaria domingensis]|nr:Sodium/solute symporter [Gracilaria domingensis]
MPTPSAVLKVFLPSFSPAYVLAPHSVQATRYGSSSAVKRPRSCSHLQSRRSCFIPRLNRSGNRVPIPRRKTAKRATPTAVGLDSTVQGGLNEALELLAATTITIPIFRRLKLSPILGFLLAGVVLGPYGTRLIKDVEDIRTLADFGVLFLLFEMGLELSLDRLRKLRKYAFGMGLFQVIVTSLVLGLGAYAMGGTVAESAAVGSALSLSSSAFILQILAEKGERQSRAGVATFGILLFQDIAVVPLLVLVPLLGNTTRLDLSHLGDGAVPAIREGAKHLISVLGTLNFIVLAGGAFLKRVFRIVADSRSSEAFTATVLLTVLGTAMFTEELGLSMTMGSFLAGVLLAETSFRSRIKIDLEPFRGLFLGLFFITTGMSLDVSLFFTEPIQVSFLIASLVFWKTAICTLIGLPFGLSLAESLRVGLLLAQGGEFAFVLFALANKLGFLPDDVNSFLVTTVVASMSLTPVLYESGKWLGRQVDKVVESSGGTVTTEATIQEVAEPESNFVLICGFGPVGRVVGRMLSRKFIRWVAIDIDVNRVRRATESNLPVVYGDSNRPVEFLEANGLSTPSAFVITISDDEQVDDTLGAIRSCFPDRPVYLRAKNVQQQKEYLRRGARAMYPESFETSLQLGQSVLEGFNTSKVDIKSIKAEVRGDSGLEEAFEEYEEWYKKNIRNPGDVQDHDETEGAEETKTVIRENSSANVVLVQQNTVRRNDDGESVIGNGIASSVERTEA